MRYNTKTYQGRELAKQQFNQLLDKCATIELDEVIDARTLPQNAARWLYLTMVANELNNRGEEYQVTEKLSNKYTKDLLYHVYWKSLQSVMFPNKKRLNTKEFSEVVEMIMVMFARLFSISIEFPSIESIRDEAV